MKVGDSIELIPYAAFGRLRLVQFADLPFSPATASDPGHGRRFSGEVVAELVNWQYLNRRWIGEALGFTEWLRLEDDPSVLRSLAIDLGTLPEEMARRILATIRLPLGPGMKEKEVIGSLGTPVAVTKVPGRTLLEFRFGEIEPYEVTCVIGESGQLTFIGVMRSAS